MRRVEYHVAASARDTGYLRSRCGTNLSRGAGALLEPLFEPLLFFENGLPVFLPKLFSDLLLDFLAEAGLLLRRGF